ncbi:formate dehydrogenase accessory sulfurtransferase FdhD [Marinobacter sp. F4216]|uniref:formate dehydrogenase accessory sulfurtransferase FdhD n=1 Tax=Marinobacter sp. F4216 TaxID=2874281 RepID=UPI001CC18237|nr:formate dehydrogenase accessory sulfurtransferase FdhD [Marinobacter sp. F4216]MBZ2169659.1 formate dehydrogenase accessory sulfurtransferase FdhD [Marinobacter sp. F4216]
MPQRSSNLGGQPPGAADSSLPLPVRELVVEVQGGVVGTPGLDSVAEEIPVALVYNGVSYAVMMASPTNLEDFALGFSMTEGILNGADQLFDLEVVASELGLSVEMHIAGECLARLKARRRNFAGRTGCGLCGVESLEQAIPAVARVTPAPVPGDGAVQRGLAHLREHQQLQEQTGATHAAAWCDSRGHIVCAREDVGRHNALDKLIGAQLQSFGDDAFRDGFVLVSSRASYEMVQKCASVGIACLVALSAPTALAIRLARQAGMTLIAFARPGRHVIYHRSEPQTEEANHD